jgi:hypothetical protein
MFQTKWTGLFASQKTTSLAQDLQLPLCVDVRSGPAASFSHRQGSITQEVAGTLRVP